MKKINIAEKAELEDKIKVVDRSVPDGSPNKLLADMNKPKEKSKRNQIISLEEEFPS